jgi:TolB-like protein/tRNA A-37 threonylcarbamoyl transferase component Bud32/Tfp pilus assembly protein PilF
VTDPNSGRDREAAALLPENWRELAVLVDTALDAAPEDRAAVLAKLSEGDATRLAVLERLVLECEQEMPLLDRPAAERFSSLFVDEAEAPLPAVLGGRYRIEREIGRGGMARVYLAHDVKHARDVAVKVIRPDLAASLGRERFLREIAIAARLRHPNIVPLYDSGDADGVLYFVMPYEDGSSLRMRLDDPSQFSVAERMSVLRDVARALAYAHERGVVHRDVKPDNVMLSGGAAVVADFGIAKAVTVAQGGDVSSTLTQSGMGIGTPAYMAPEQALGDPSTDHRADIYSFGCLAYELFAGRPPFAGLSNHEIIAAHLTTKPVPVGDASKEIPASVASLITRCLEKNPADRPQRASELLVDLEANSPAPPPVARLRRLPRAAVATLLPLGLLVVGVGAYFAFRARDSDTAPTVAVLPFQSESGDTLQRQLADGLSDEIGTALFKVPGVRLMSRRGAGQYGGREIDLQKTGRALGANFLVMGSFREVEGGFRVLANLVAVRDGAIVWSDQFDRRKADLGPVRDEIARDIGDALRRSLGASVGRVADDTRKRSINPEAFRLYVLGQRALTHRGQSVRASADMFRAATRLDPLYADAFSGLSLALALEPYFQPTSLRALAAEVTSAAEVALRLDSSLAQPHVALGLVHQHAYEWDRASEEFQTALRLRRSDDIEPLVQYGRHLIFRGRAKEALQQFLEARRTEPALALVSSWVSYAYYLDGQLDSALAESGRAFQNDSMNITTTGLGALVRLKAGRRTEALDFAVRAQASPVPIYVFAAVGDTTRVRQKFEQVQRVQGTSWMRHTMRAYAMLGAGDTTKAMDELERATDANEMWPSLEATRDPMFDSIRGSARFRQLLQRVGLSASVP